MECVEVQTSFTPASHLQSETDEKKNKTLDIYNILLPENRP